MLDDWEAQELAAIERELSSDPTLVRSLAGPTRRERRWCTLERHFYPTGYLLAATAYMLAALGGGQRQVVVEAALIAVAVWLVLEVRATGARTFVANGLQGMGRWLHG